MIFNKLTDNLCNFFKKHSILVTESGLSVTVDIDFADHPPTRVDGHNNLGSCLDGTGKIPGIGVDIIDDDSFTALNCGSTDTFTNRDSCMWGWVANERSNDQHLSVGWVEHIKTHPAEVSETLCHTLNDASFQILKRCLESLKESEFVKKGVPFHRVLLPAHISRSHLIE
jgi:hypothetical protein